MKPRTRPGRSLLIVALAMIGACGKEKTTALDLQLTVAGAIDQVRIDAVTLGGASVVLGTDETLFPASPRTLKTGDVLTLWFADSADMQAVTVTATGLLCGKNATAQVMTAQRTLSKSATVTATLALTNNGTTCTGDGGAGRGGGGAGGAAGAGGGAGAAGGAGVGGVSGTGGSTGGGSAGTGGTGVAGSAGGAGRGGTGGTTGGSGGSAGTGGAAGRGGTGGTGGGTAGTGGAAGRGGTGGTTGTGGAAGRGGTTGSAGTGGGAAGRGGTTGSAGTGGGAAGRGGTGGGRVCSTTPAAAFAQSFGTTLTTPTTCGYPSFPPAGVQHIWTGNDVFALVSASVYGNSASCGRCVELVRTSPTQTRRATVTIVGSCNDPVCVALPNDARFQLSLAAYDMLALPIETSLPLAGETLTYSFVGCLVPLMGTGPEPIRADFVYTNGIPTGVLFVGQRWGIGSATATVAGTSESPLMRGNDNTWRLLSGMVFGTGTVAFSLTDTNLANVSFNLSLQNPQRFMPTTAQFPTCP